MLSHAEYRDLKQRMQSFKRNLPARLKDRSDSWVATRNLYGNYVQIITHLDRTYNEFLLERTLVKRLRLPSTELVNISRSLLSTMLVMIGNRHRQGQFASDLPWLVNMQHFWKVES